MKDMLNTEVDNIKVMSLQAAEWHHSKFTL